ncbi:hypothetical protein [Dysosmobacter sp.]|uniref:hypothetical protein n=1 Tax=Dysosmobacter sp. TaxID=2591382 RepID=UPI002A8F75F4|nr:hypothetical protein [Dysosmobacter sp.]MDY3282621.1 hypothetical protein [Dysosmobacter sp.]
MADLFDDLLKEALIQAMEEDLRDLPEDSRPMSDRQRRRMEQLLADPDACRAAAEEAKAAAPGKRGKWRFLRFTAAAAAVALLATSAIAYTVTGGAFFREMFLRRAGEEAYAACMDADQLLELGSKSVGTVVENENLRLELVDAVCSGNTAMVAVRVTAKQLESFSQESGEYRNYGFLDVSDSISQGDEAFGAGWRYVFSDEDPTLADNECFLVLTITSRSEIPEGTYRVLLGDFGWETADSEEVLYPGSWELPVHLSGENGASQTVELAAELPLNGYTYLLTEAVSTPLTLTMEFTCDSGDPDCPDGLLAALGSLELRLRDGTVLRGQDFTTLCSAAGTGERWNITVGLEFSVPLPAGAVQCLSLGGQTLELDLPALD